MPVSPEIRISRGPVDAADRPAARALLIARRLALPPAERAAADEAIAEALLAEIAALHPAPAGPVAVYWPMRGEPELAAAWSALDAAGHRLCLPVVVARDAALAFGQWRPGDPLARAGFGVLVPAQFVPVDPDLLVIPCVGFDLDGHRLGYGGGFYDRTLAGGQRVALGVAHDTCEMTGFVAQPYDRPLQRVITERRCLPG